jgi:hypothetical protein
MGIIFEVPAEREFIHWQMMIYPLTLPSPGGRGDSIYKRG